MSVSAETSKRGGAPERRTIALLGTGLALVLIGSLLAWWVQTDGGRIEVRDVRFAGPDGEQMSALLYLPPGASPQSPAPGILAVHGYINSRETQSGFAIELARRGHVVLALDQTGHGFSDPPAFSRGFGGPAGLRYLRSLEVVDPDNVGLEGHSMGGWAVLSAADAIPEGYRSMALVGSSTGSYGTPEGTPVFPRNLAVIFGRWDEFSSTMWGAPTAAALPDTEKLRALFGTDEPVEVGRVYGDADDGTARILFLPRTTHPGEHLSTAAIGRVVEWMERTLRGGRTLPTSDQTWYWKELGTLLALLGLAVSVLPAGALLLRTPYFATLRSAPGPARGATGVGWWSGAALTAALPVLTYYPLQNLGSAAIPPNAAWPQSVTTGITVWALGNALLSGVLLGVWHRVRGRTRGAGSGSYGLASDRGRIGKSALLAVAVAGFAYALLAAADALFQIDFRFWVVALKPMGALHLRIAAGYLPAFVVFFVVLGAVLHGQLRRPDTSLSAAMTRNAGLLAGGFVVLLGVQYVPLLAGRPLPLGEPLLTIVAFQFVPLLAFVAATSTYFFRRTGTVYVGAFFNALFVTWYVVAGQATHHGFG